MFGVVPKKIWGKLIQPDDQNLCTWALRCLYIESGNRRILIDTGLGNKQSDKFFAHYEPQGEILIWKALLNQEIDPGSITDVILTHLHFDHVGGALMLNENSESVPSLPNAVYWVHPEHWDYALHPNAREKASFLPENIKPLQTVNKLKFLHQADFPNIEFIRVDGHTQAMVLPLISVNRRKLLFSADLFPSVYHVPLPYIMAYDMQPLITLKEKEIILNRCIQENIDLFFEHDISHEVAIVKRHESGKAVIESTCSLEEWTKIG